MVRFNGLLLNTNEYTNDITLLNETLDNTNDYTENEEDTKLRLKKKMI